MKRESVSSMSFNRAAWTGNLTRSEYTALASWYGGMLLIMFYGITLSKTVVPDYLGLLIWVITAYDWFRSIFCLMITIDNLSQVTSWLVICTLVPVLKYFNTYTFDATMLFMVKFNLTFHFFFCLLFFVVTLQMDLGVFKYCEWIVFCAFSIFNFISICRLWVRCGCSITFSTIPCSCSSFLSRIVGEWWIIDYILTFYIVNDIMRISFGQVWLRVQVPEYGYESWRENFSYGWQKKSLSFPSTIMILYFHVFSFL